jgi:uncharacterized cofD-like protein
MRPRDPQRITALGGGTGLPSVLSGLRELVIEGRVDSLTAVVVMTDDGGSSGRLRKSRRIPPPGDIRNCLAALAAEKDLVAGLFQYRYKGSEELGGHTVGNLILTALAEQTGSFLKAVEVTGRVLNITGKILPTTLDDVALAATLEDGSSIVGESAIGSCGKRIKRVSLQPARARPTPGVVEAIEDADMVVLGPGSLYTSLVPHLVVEETAQALRRTGALRVLVANLVCEKGESAGLDLAGHLGVLEAHAGGPVVDAVLINTGAIGTDVLRRYEEEGTCPLSCPMSAVRGVHVVCRNMLAEGPKLRHDPKETTAGLLTAWRETGMQARAAVEGA